MTQPVSPPQLTIKDILVESLRRADITEAQASGFPVSQKFNFSGHAWETNKPAPGNNQIQVFAIFHGDAEDQVPGDVRVYCIPIGPDGEFARYILSRVHPTLLAEAMNYERFVQEIAEEWSTLQELFGAEDEEDEAELVECPSCKATTEITLAVEDEAGGEEVEEAEVEDVPAKFCGNCGVGLPAPTVMAEVVS